MYIKLRFCLILICMVIHYIDGAKIKEKPSNAHEDEKTGLQQSEVRPQYINQFSESLKFLGSFFRIIQKQLNDSITNFNPNRPNPIFSALLANPTLIPFALRRLREPLSEMITITNRIEQIVSTNNPKQLENNNELQKLLQQLNRRLQSLFGPLIPHNPLTARMPTTFPAALESFSNWVSQMASMLAIFSQSVRDVTTSDSSDSTPNQWSLLSNRSDIPSEVDNICSQLKAFSQISIELNSQNLTEKQDGGAAGLVGDLTTAVGNTLTVTLGVAGGLVTGLFGTVNGVLTTAQTALFGGGGLARNSTIVVPLSIDTIQDFQQIRVGVINPQNKLIIANILTKDQVNSNNTISNEDLVSRLSLNSLQSLMSSLANDLKDIKDPKILTSLKCQLESFDCSIRNRDNYSEVQTCLKSLSTCIGNSP